MSISYLFAGITLIAVILATFLNQTRQAILSLWIAGLAMGAIYLTIGVELLAIIQWIVSTLVTVSFVFFAVMFGEFNPSALPQKRKINWLMFLSLCLGLAFIGVIWLGIRGFPAQSQSSSLGLSDLTSMGKILTQEYFLSLEILGLILFFVLVGGGVISRFEGDEQE